MSFGRSRAMQRAAILVALLMFGKATQAGDSTTEELPYSATAEVPAPVLSLRLPAEERIAFRGVVNFDGVGTGSSSFLYPAPNAGTFLAGVIVHGLFVESAKQEQKQKLQAEADKILQPYETVLNSYRLEDLMHRGLARIATTGEKKIVKDRQSPDTDWFIETAPGFSMTQDQKAIILDNVIVIHRPGAAAGAAFRNVVRAVSSARTESDLVAYWTANDGLNLKEETADLLAESLDIALAEAMHGPIHNSNPHKTYRYFEGDIERMERAQLISERCNRLVIRTLRGWPMAIPARNANAISPACEAAMAAPPLAHETEPMLR